LKRYRRATDPIGDLNGDDQSGDEMNGFYLIFTSDVTAAVFCFSAATILLSATAFLPKRAGAPMSIRRHIVSGFGFAFAALGIGFALHAMSVTTSAAGQSGPAASILPLELQRSIGTKSLPVQEFDNQAVVFEKD
jgi:hypothetical protein